MYFSMNGTRILVLRLKTTLLDSGMDGPAPEAPLAQPTKRSQGSESYSNTMSSYSYPTCGYDIDTHNPEKQQLKPDNRSILLIHFSPPHRTNPYYSPEISNTQAQPIDYFTSNSATRSSYYGDIFPGHQNIAPNEIIPPVEAYNPHLQQFDEQDPHQQHQGVSAFIWGLSPYQEDLLCSFPGNFQDGLNVPSALPFNTTNSLDSTLDGYTYNFNAEAALGTGECKQA
jgi:hypothetical protein